MWVPPRWRHNHQRAKGLPGYARQNFADKIVRSFEKYESRQPGGYNDERTNF
jgi:hypothetical protein